MPVVFYDRDCARISGRVWAPRAGQARLPGVVIEPGAGQAPETAYWWMAQALVRHLAALRVERPDGARLFAGVFAIFGHGNVTSLGHSLEMHRDKLPTWRGQNEQGMGLAAAAYAKAKRRQQIMVATSSISISHPALTAVLRAQ